MKRSTFLRSLVGALALAATSFVILRAAGDAPSAAPAPTPAPAPIKDIRIVLHTTKGDIAGTLFATKAPMTVANYLNLATKGFYDGLLFHRVIADFMIQGGDPLSKDESMKARWGSGGPGYNFRDETRQDLKLDKPGVFAMANSDQGKTAYSNTGMTNGSQFFITHKATSWLDGMHTVFGQVTKGQDVVNKIAQGDKITKIEILDPTDVLFKAQAENLAKWNAVLKK
jgi:peptidyl-prolyl cis-trans isomerase B (cyclophilin B)